MEMIAALVVLAVLAVSVATSGVAMMEQRPQAGSALMWAGIGTIAAVEFTLPFMLL